MAFAIIPAVLAGLSSLFTINDQIGAAKAKLATKTGNGIRNISLNRRGKMNTGRGIHSMYNTRFLMGRGCGRGMKRRIAYRRKGKGMLGNLLGNIPVIGNIVNALGLGMRGRRIMNLARLRSMMRGKGIHSMYNTRFLMGRGGCGGLLSPSGGLLGPVGSRKLFYGSAIGAGRVKVVRSVRGHYKYVKKGRGIKGYRRVHVRSHIKRS